MVRGISLLIRAHRLFRCFGSISLVVTNARITGNLGLSRVDIPLSAVSSAEVNFSGVLLVETSMRLIKFPYLSNDLDVLEVISEQFVRLQCDSTQQAPDAELRRVRQERQRRLRERQRGEREHSANEELPASEEQLESPSENAPTDS